VLPTFGLANNFPGAPAVLQPIVDNNLHSS
jgi:hypothetical protein